MSTPGERVSIYVCLISHPSGVLHWTNILLEFRLGPGETSRHSSPCPTGSEEGGRGVLTGSRDPGSSQVRRAQRSEEGRVDTRPGWTGSVSKWKKRVTVGGEGHTIGVGPVHSDTVRGASSRVRCPSSAVPPVRTTVVPDTGPGPRHSDCGSGVGVGFDRDKVVTDEGTNGEPVSLPCPRNCGSTLRGVVETLWSAWRSSTTSGRDPFHPGTAGERWRASREGVPTRHIKSTHERHEQ